MLHAAPNNAGPSAFLGRFAQAHRKSRKSPYASLRASGRLGSCLADLDHQAEEMHDRLCAQVALQEGVTEQFKAADQLDVNSGSRAEAARTFSRTVTEI